MILRPSYIEAIAPFIDQPLVKILAGVRRCGKSTIFEMLTNCGVVGCRRTESSRSAIQKWIFRRIFPPRICTMI